MAVMYPNFIILGIGIVSDKNHNPEMIYIQVTFMMALGYLSA